MSNETLHAIGRLRRAQSRNSDTMLVCDELERLLQVRPIVAKNITALDIPQLKPGKFEVLPECPTCAERKKQTRERVERLRKRRAEGEK